MSVKAWSDEQENELISLYTVDGKKMYIILPNTSEKGIVVL